jgi:glycosyltransferase involved in cell wall biosynthesis
MELEIITSSNNIGVNALSSPLVTVILPTYNEEKYIGDCLQSLISCSYSKSLFEILVVDGCSSDNTQSVVKKYELGLPKVKLLINERKTVPFAMNLGIRNAKGKVIIRVDAHSIYPCNYIESLVHALDYYKVDNVGGVWETVPADDTNQAQAVALILSTPFGVGNAKYRVGVKKPIEVDTVPFGCYRRSIFDQVGFYDESLMRNQDDELNARIINNGGKILLLPDLAIRYFARENFEKLAMMLFQYGYFKPLVNLKIGKVTTMRQLAPPVFVVFVLLMAIFSFFTNVFYFFTFLLFYFSTALLISYSLTKKIGVLKLMPIGFFIAHFSYGAGYLKGILDFIVLKKIKK